MKYLFVLIFITSMVTDLKSQKQYHINPRIDTVFLIKEKNLIPENISYDPIRKSFLIGSMYKRKISRIGKQSELTDFVRAGTEGMKAVLGMKADVQNNCLWVASIKTGFVPTDQVNDKSWHGGVYQFNLATGKFLWKEIAKDSTLFNDLTIDDKSDVYLTGNGSVYHVDHRTRRLKRFLPVNTFEFPNGITTAGKYLFVSNGNGVSRIDKTSKEIVRLQTPAGTSLEGIDGLYYYKQSLIGVQNGVSPKRIIQALLDENMRAVKNIIVLDSSSLPRNLYSPTTGVLVNDDFYFINNAQVRSFNSDGTIFPMDKLNDILIRRIRLSNGK
jgi:hypothetical protein